MSARKRGYKKFARFEFKTDCRDLDLDVYIHTDNGGFLIELDNHEFKGKDLKELKKEVEREAIASDTATFHAVIEYDLHDRYGGYNDHHKDHSVRLRWRVALVSHQTAIGGHKPRLEQPHMLLTNPETGEVSVLRQQYRSCVTHEEDPPFERAHQYTEWWEHSIEFTSERYRKLKYVSDGIDQLNKILDDVLGSKDPLQVETQLDGMGQLLLPAPETPPPPTEDDDGGLGPAPDPVVEQVQKDIEAHFTVDPEFAAELAAQGLATPTSEDDDDDR